MSKMDHSAAEKFLRINISKARYAARAVRGLEFEIDIYDVMKLLKKQEGRCALTGWEMEYTRGGNFGYATNPKACSIDRIYNTSGYLPWNIQLVCWKVNKIKGELGNWEFKQLCQLVVNKLHSEVDQ